MALVSNPEHSIFPFSIYFVEICNGILKRTKINKKRQGLVQFFYRFKRSLTKGTKGTAGFVKMEIRMKIAICVGTTHKSRKNNHQFFVANSVTRLGDF